MKRKIALLLLLLALAAVACTESGETQVEPIDQLAEPTPTLAPTNSTPDNELYQPGEMYSNCWRRDNGFSFEVEGGISGIPSLPIGSHFSVTISYSDGSTYTEDTSPVNHEYEYLPTTISGSVIYPDGTVDSVPAVDITCPLAD